MKTLTDFRKTVETGVDPRLLFVEKHSFPLSPTPPPPAPHQKKKEETWNFSGKVPAYLF